MVGLDLSLKSSGIAVIKGPHDADFYSFGYSLPAKITSQEKLNRYLNISKQIIRVLSKYKIDQIGIEDYGYGGQGLAVQCELGGIIKSQLYLALNQVSVSQPSGTIRKYILGPTKKAEVKDQIKQIVRDHLLGLGYPHMENLDQSDALAVAHMLWHAKHSDSLNEYQREVKAKIDFQSQRGDEAKAS